jgi:hypothetical protein
LNKKVFAKKNICPSLQGIPNILGRLFQPPSKEKSWKKKLYPQLSSTKGENNSAQF